MVVGMTLIHSIYNVLVSTSCFFANRPTANTASVEIDEGETTSILTQGDNILGDH
jgi:hypothetical protein